MGLAAPPRKNKACYRNDYKQFFKTPSLGRGNNPIGFSMKRCSESRKEAARGTFFLLGQLPKLVHGTFLLCTKQGRRPRLPQR